MEKVIIIGCPGSGKSTFARRLKEKTGLPLFYLDMIWHKPDKTNITEEEFDIELEKILSKNRWIIDGNYQRTLELRMEKCDTVFFLDFPLEVCILGAKSRVGKARVDMPWVEAEFDLEFEQFILGFQKNQLPKIYDLLKKYNNKDIIIFKNRDEIEQYFERSSGAKPN